MRQPRNFAADRCYHLVSRIANRAFYLSEEERTRFVERMWRVAYFSCVDVLAYCVMDNHFHILAYVPPQRELSAVPGPLRRADVERERVHEDAQAVDQPVLQLPA